MTRKQMIKLFGEKNIRTVWDDKEEKWYFSIVDVVEVLTDSADPKQYIKKMRRRDPQLDANWGTICTLVQMKGADGKKRKQMAADTKGMFRLIQSIPSPKADDNWINQRIKSIEVRKELTDEWKRTGVKEGLEYASLTDIITKEWSGMTTKQYKQHKGLKKENLRDNMTNLEMAFNILAEASATELSKQRDPQGYRQQKEVAKDGGSVAKVAREKLESQLGHSVISSAKASDYLPPVEDADAKELPEE